MPFISAETLDVNKSAVFTVPVGCTFLLVKMAHATGGPPSTRTLGGTTLDLIAGRANDISLYAAIYQRVSPPSGSITLSHNSTAVNSIATLEYYNDINLTTPVRLPAAMAGGVFGTSYTTLNVTSVAGDLCSDVFGHGSSGTLTMGGAQTTVANTVVGTQVFGASRRTATGTSTNFSWTTSANSRQVHVIVALIPASGGGSAIAAISSGHHNRGLR
jgi:hypothetical protein